MHLHYIQNDDTASTQPMLEPIASSQPLLPPFSDNVSPSLFLPNELIEKILLRLPFRYLLQYRCVCKLWKTLISDSQFTKKHLLCSTADQSMTHLRLACAFVNIPEEIVSYPLMSLYENPPAPVNVIPDSFSGLNSDISYEIIGSCNGLLCLCDKDQCTVILYNPSIKLKSKKSPKYASPWPDWLMIRSGGFGYDQVNGKYKVLLFLYNMNSKETFIKIYTFGEDSWRTIPNWPRRPICLAAGQCVSGKYVSGTLNWFCYNKTHVVSDQYIILSFDLEKEIFREWLLPQNVGDGYHCTFFLQVLTNCLCVSFASKTHWVVWLMKEYGVVESWTKLMTIPCEKFILNTFTKMLFISENGVLLMSTSSQLILYNINSGELDYPSISTPQQQQWESYNFTRFFFPYIYDESLISPPRW